MGSRRKPREVCYVQTPQGTGPPETRRPQNIAPDKSDLPGNVVVRDVEVVVVVAVDVEVEVLVAVVVVEVDVIFHGMGVVRLIAWPMDGGGSALHRQRAAAASKERRTHRFDMAGGGLEGDLAGNTIRLRAKQSGHGKGGELWDQSFDRSEAEFDQVGAGIGQAWPMSTRFGQFQRTSDRARLGRN